MCVRIGDGVENNQKSVQATNQCVQDLAANVGHQGKEITVLKGRMNKVESSITTGQENNKNLSNRVKFLEFQSAQKNEPTVHSSRQTPAAQAGADKQSNSDPVRAVSARREQQKIGEKCLCACLFHSFIAFLDLIASTL